MTRKQKRNLRRVLLSAALALLVSLLPPSLLPTVWPSGAEQGLLRLLLFFVPYWIVGYDVLRTAFLNLVHGRLLDEKFLMAISTVGAFVLGEYTEAVAVMLLFQVGELFESIAVGKSRRHIAALMEIKPERAVVLRDGAWVELPPEAVEIGEQIRILPGEKIPLDGYVVEGASALNTAALTGESLPQDIYPGCRVVSGAINMSGKLVVKTDTQYADSTVARILDLVENAAEKKAKVEGFITRFAHWYTPCVVIGALLLALIPSLLGGDATVWIYRALLFLVVSCPCALVVSVPLTFFGGIGGASRRGILIKGAGYIEVLSRAHTVVFDKTGTLTRGSFNLSEIQPICGKKEDLLRLAASLEAHSSHPIARSVCAACTQPLWPATDVCELAGHGMKGYVNGHFVMVGNARLLEVEAHEIARPVADAIGTQLYVVVDGVLQGRLLLADEAKPNAKDMIRALRTCGVRRTVMLTGDRTVIAESLGRELGIDAVHGNLLPDDKVQKIEELLTEKPGLVYVGDGINDAPVLSRADVGVAMGGMGSDAAIEAADVVLMEDRLDRLPALLRLSRMTMRIARQNIVLALAVKGLVLLLSVLGIANMWLAIFADVGVLILTILNAMRSMYIGKRKD